MPALESTDNAVPKRIVCPPRRVAMCSGDVGTHIRFSRSRCLLTIVSLLLVITDVPRSGLVLSLNTSSRRVSPGVWLFSNAINYHVVQIQRNISKPSYTGSRNGSPIAATRLWSYKFDTLSIPLRALAQKFNVASVPAFVKSYDAKHNRLWNTSSLLDLETTFHIIDGLVHTLQTHRATHRTPFAFCTTSAWIDRLHHVVAHWMWPVIQPRVHTIHSFTTSPSEASSNRSVCFSPFRATDRPTLADVKSFRQNSFVCDHSIDWRCSHPTRGASATIGIAEHINYRWLLLRRQFPSLHLDFVVISSRRLLSSSRVPLLPSVFFKTDSLEVTTFARGRRCWVADLVPTCETVFVDDYRYERATVETNFEDWKLVVKVLRGGSQLYIWIRVAILWAGCFRENARGERTTFGQRFLGAARMMALIPGHVIVYGSWPPVLGHALAHLIDSSITQQLTSNFWATTNGLLQKERLVTYALTASIQMRNLWVIVLIWKLAFQAVGVSQRVFRYDVLAWTPHDGVFGFRAILTSSISALTVLSFYRQLNFRNSDVLGFMELPVNIHRQSAAFGNICVGKAEFGYLLDVKTTIVSTMIVLTSFGILQGLVRLTTRRRTNFFVSRSFYVPWSMDYLWPRAFLNMHWHLDLLDDPNEHLPLSRRGTKASRIGTCAVCDATSSIVHWRGIQGCTQHDSVAAVTKRSDAEWAMVRLINTTVMSDPLELLRLYVIGKRVFLYQRTRHVSDEQPSLLLLPTPAAAGENCDWDGAGRQQELVLVALVSSSCVPWHALVCCG